MLVWGGSLAAGLPDSVASAGRAVTRRKGGNVESDQQLVLVTTVPPEHLNAVLAAISAAGAGMVGGYSECAFVCAGTGRFRASADANPAYGERGELNEVAEVRIETWVARSRAREVVAALRAAHPYEEPVIYLIPLIDLAGL